MGSVSLPVILLVILVVGAFLAIGIRNPKPRHVKVTSKADLLSEVQSYAAKGYQAVLDRGNLVVLNRKVPFNWVATIIMLFIPVIGWIALLILIFANKNKIQSVTIEMTEPA